MKRPSGAAVVGSKQRISASVGNEPIQRPSVIRDQMVQDVHGKNVLGKGLFANKTNAAAPGDATTRVKDSAKEVKKKGKSLLSGIRKVI